MRGGACTRPTPLTKMVELQDSRRFAIDLKDASSTPAGIQKKTVCEGSCVVVRVLWWGESRTTTTAQPASRGALSFGVHSTLSSGDFEHETRSIPMISFKQRTSVQQIAFLQGWVSRVHIQSSN